MESIIFVIGGICVFSVGCLLCMECCTDGESIESANIIETVQTLHTTQTPLPNDYELHPKIKYDYILFSTSC